MEKDSLLKLDIIAKRSDDHVEGDDICSAYSNGKCLEYEGKYCDACASEYERVV